MGAESRLRNRRFSAKIELDPGHFGGIFRKNKFEVVGTCSAFWTFGVCIALLRPSLWDLGCQTGTPLSHMTWIFFVQTLFTMFGSFVGGMLLHSFKIDASVVILFSVVLISCTLIVIPFCISIFHLAYSFAVMGMAMGLIDTAATISFIKKFKMDASPFIQALYCCYGIGAFCSPLILRFFVKDFDFTTFLGKSSNATGGRWIISHQMHRSMIPDEKGEYDDLREIRASLRIKEGFFLLALLQLPVIIATAFMSIGKICYHHSLKYEGTVDNDSMAESKQQQNAKIYVLSLSVALLFFSSGMEVTFGGLIFTFCKLVIPTIEAQEAVNIDAIFWGCFALGRFGAIFAATSFSNGFILLCDTTGCLVSYCVLYAFQGSTSGLYCGVALFGLFLSTVSPTTISLTEQFVDIGPITTSCLVVGAAFGEMSYPVFMGNRKRKSENTDDQSIRRSFHHPDNKSSLVMNPWKFRYIVMRQSFTLISVKSALHNITAWRAVVRRNSAAYQQPQGLLQQNNGPNGFLFGVLATIIIMQIVFICFWIIGVRSRGFTRSSAGSMLFEFSKIPNDDELESNYELIPTDE